MSAAAERGRARRAAGTGRAAARTGRTGTGPARTGGPAGEVLLEVAPREDTRSPVTGRPGRLWRPVLLLSPAAALVGAFLVVPLLTTFVVSVTAGGEGPTLRHYGLVLDDPRVLDAITNSLWWLALAPLVCAVGLLLAWVGHNAVRSRPFLLGVLAAPAAVSALVTGLVFRMMFDPLPQRGTVASVLDALADVAGAPGGGAARGTWILGSGWVWLVLGLAFAWGWAGLAVVVFREGMAAVPRDLLRMARSFGAGRLERARLVVAPALVPIVGLVLLILLVGAARVFELVLLAAPGPMQSEVEVIATHWWRWRSELGDGRSAALAVLQFLFVGAAALVAMWGLSRDWPTGRPGAGADAPARTPARARLIRVAESLVIGVWLIPFALLLLTSLHDPVSASRSGWWASGGWGLGSYERAFASGELWDALVTTGLRATLAAVLLTLVAVPAAYALAWGGLSRRTGRVLVAVTAVLAVLPPQAVAVPLGDAFSGLQVLGAPTVLTVVYVAFGVPFAVLLLRRAFVTMPLEIVDARLAEAEPGSALAAVLRGRWHAAVAVAVLEFVLVWNDFVVGLLLGGPETGQVTLVLFGESRQLATSLGMVAAGAVISFAVPLALLLVTGRWVMRGLTAGVMR